MDEKEAQNPAVKPKLFDDPALAEKFRNLHQRIKEHHLITKTNRARETTKNHLSVGSMRVTLDDIQAGITTYFSHKSDADVPSTSSSQSTLQTNTNSSTADSVSTRQPRPFFKITLLMSDIILLFEQRSITELRQTEAGELVEADNQLYDYLTLGKGKLRRRTEALAQTTDILYKSRAVNTENIRSQNKASYVSIFEMFDTYKDLETSTKSLQVDGQQQLEVTTYKVRGVDSFIAINSSEKFKLALMLTTRVLAGNIYEQSQRRFRNMTLPDPLAMDAQYRYSLNVLWSYIPHLPADEKVPAVADISWCHSNGDILAVAYGIYACYAFSVPKHGYVCVWNIKNPVNPERNYQYHTPVTAVEFSSLVPQLLAIGLYDGNVEVRDITEANFPPVAISQRKSSPNCEPVVAFRWLSQEYNGNVEMRAFLALSQDGSVTKYSIINSPYLLGFRQMVLDRVESSAEGLILLRPSDNMQSNRHPQGLNLTRHPLQQDIYYILTEEGCIHKCSTNYPQQHIEVIQAHEAAINAMDFSPWSPKLFLTCGNDWCIRIWLDGISKPLITLKHSRSPIHCAYWSKTHSTVIVAANRKSIDIWDLRRNILKPVSTHSFGKSYNTEFRFSNCGRSLALGNERGNVTLLAFEDMPFPAHFQYDELEAAIYKALADNAELKKIVKSFGYIGYGDKKKKPFK